MADKIYQLHISLQYSEPLIWRRVLVKSNILLPDLHNVIQVAIGWDDSHLHRFIKDKIIFTPSNDARDYDSNMYNYRKIKLDDVIVRTRSKFFYEYDSGDCWEHIIQLEKMLPYDESIPLPQCIDGEFGGPPEDCGGIWRYNQIYKVLTDPNADKDEEDLEFLGEDFVPYLFSKDAVNSRLKKYFVKKPKKQLSSKKK